MAQQINLHSPILLVPRRHFSALAMLHSLGVLAAGLLALSLWSISQTQGLRRDLAAATAADSAEQQRLKQALAARPAVPTNLAALEQELAQARRQFAEREALLAGITASVVDSRVSRSVLLRLLAQTLPETAWLSEVKLVDGRVELLGATLQPEALRPWLDRLQAQPALAGQALAAVQVERRELDAGSGRESWSFRVVSSRASTPAVAPITDAGVRP